MILISRRGSGPPSGLIRLIAAVNPRAIYPGRSNRHTRTSGAWQAAGRVRSGHHPNIPEPHCPQYYCLWVGSLSRGPTRKGDSGVLRRSRCLRHRRFDGAARHGLPGHHRRTGKWPPSAPELSPVGAWSSSHSTTQPPGPIPRGLGPQDRGELGPVMAHAMRRSPGVGAGGSRRGVLAARAGGVRSTLRSLCPAA
jgi:hypothetical protein